VIPFLDKASLWLKLVRMNYFAFFLLKLLQVQTLYFAGKLQHDAYRMT
jgi:hypothetical protein